MTKDQTTINGKTRVVAIYVALASFVMLFLFEHADMLNRQIDDAYISYRYAENFANGLGLVFNSGERVEGYSNLLWVLLVSFGASLGVEAHIVGFLLALGTSAALLIATYYYTKALLPPHRQWLALAAPAILLSTNSFTEWSSSGLETPLFALVCVLACLSAHAKRHALSIACTLLAMLTRPDGMLFVAAILGAPLLQSLYTKGLGVFQWTHFKDTAFFVAALLALTIWRVAYYGDYVPNTYHAKVGGIPIEYGVNYTWRFWMDGAFLLLLPFIFAVVVSRRLLVEFLFFALMSSYIISVGGDVFPNSRFFLPVLPMLIAGSLLGWSIALQRLQGFSPLLFVWLFCTLGWYVYGPPLHPLYLTMQFEKVTFPESVKRKATIRTPMISDQSLAAVDAIAESDALIATTGIGRVGYVLKRPVLDLLGLTDRTIAMTPTPVDRGAGVHLPGHMRSNADYVMQRSPEIIMIPSKGSESWFIAPAVRDIWQHEKLDKDYYFDPVAKVYRKRN